MSSVIKIKDKGVKKLLKGLMTQKNKIDKRAKSYAALVGSSIIKDVFEHFERQQGPDGKWKAWSPAYRKLMIKRRKGGNKILQDTGRLKQAWTPTSYRTSLQGITWFNAVKYANRHDKGTGGMPKRSFTWISDKAIERIEKQTAKFMLKK